MLGKQERAAIVIQKHIRGFLQQRSYLKALLYILLLQRNFRRFRLRKLFILKMKSIKSIQLRMLTCILRWRFTRMRNAASRVKIWLKSKIFRLRYLHLIHEINRMRWLVR